MPDSRIVDLIQQAAFEYEMGNLDAAYSHSREVLDRLGAADSMEALNAATLLQTVCAYKRNSAECIALEQPIRDMIFQLFPQNAGELYVMHFSDYTSQLFSMNLKEEYRNAVTSFLPFISSVYKDENIIAFYKNYFSARVAFLEEDYHAALRAADIANENWTYDFLDEMGKNNLLLMCSCNAKINNPDTSITFLENALRDNAFSAKEQLSAQSILAELYLRADRTGESLALLERLYRDPIYLKSLSANAAEEFYYNYALTLIQDEKYEAAVNILLRALPKGYPLLAAVYSCLDTGDSVQKISSFFHECCSYLEKQILQIKANYREDLAYSHLSLLQYQIDFALYAFISCITEKESPAKTLSFSTYDVYCFLLHTKYVSLGFSAESEKDISPKAVMDSLDQHTLLLEYTKTYTFDQCYYHVFLVSAQEITCITLGACETIDACIAEFLALITSNRFTFEELLSLPEYRRQKDRLRRLLYLPIQEVASDFSRLIIAPAGNLINFPFALLPISSRENLSEDHDILYCNTGKELVWRLAHAPEPAGIWNPFIIGAPAYNHFPPLEHAHDECQFISETFNAPSYLSDDATAECITGHDLTEHNLIHIAAHGVFASDPRNPHTHHRSATELTWHQLEESMRNTGILLSEDSLLDCSTIAGLPLSNIRLATLSCCYSGQSTYQNTEGAYGMRRAFLTAGCQKLLVSLWNIDDTAASLFMRCFYQSLKSSGHIEAAFRTSVEFLKNYEEDGNKPYRSPFYWAGYELIL